MRFLMSQRNSARDALVSVGQFSTQTGPFSTQVVARFQLRDLVFVTRASTSGYLTTGVESRSWVAFAPTIRRDHRSNNAPRADRRTGRTRSRIVSRLS